MQLPAHLLDIETPRALALHEPRTRYVSGAILQFEVAARRARICRAATSKDLEQSSPYHAHRTTSRFIEHSNWGRRMYRKILVPIDTAESSIAEPGVLFAAQLAALTNGAVRMIHVLSTLPSIEKALLIPRYSNWLRKRTFRWGSSRTL
jgi:hypothetical protein